MIGPCPRSAHIAQCFAVEDTADTPSSPSSSDTSSKAPFPSSPLESNSSASTSGVSGDGSISASNGHAVPAKRSRQVLIVFGGWNGNRMVDDTFAFDAITFRWSKIVFSSVIITLNDTLFHFSKRLEQRQVLE